MIREYFSSMKTSIIQHHYKRKNNKHHITIPANSLFDIKEINGDYWLATDKGVYVLDENYNLIDRYHTSHPTNKIISNRVRSITQESEYSIWLGTENGLNVINPNSKFIKTIQNEDEGTF